MANDAELPEQFQIFAKPIHKIKDVKGEKHWN